MTTHDDNRRSTVTRQARLDACRRHVARLDRRRSKLEHSSRRFTQARVGAVLVGIVATVLTHRQLGETASWIVLGVCIGLFLLLVARHRRVQRALRRLDIWRRLKLTQIARMTLDWERIPYRGDVAPRFEHPYECDLDLSGRRSLRHLIDTAMSSGGSERLGDWLLDFDPEPERVARRQAQVRALIPRSTFRDRLALAGLLVAGESLEPWDGERLLRWLDRHAGSAPLRKLLLLLTALAAANVLLFTLAMVSDWRPWWVITATVYLGLYLFKHRDYDELFEEAEYLQHTLDLFRAVLLYLERCPFGRFEPIASLCAPFRDAARPPSRELSRIAWIVAAAGLQRNQILWFLVNVVVPWDFFFADRFHRYKERIRHRLPDWLDAWYELEALNSLAEFAHLHPNYVMPEVAEPVAPAAGRPDVPVLDARALGHPLLADDVRVCNDFALVSLGDVVFVTGSNMSGKSTFLRTLGINLCLGFAGGPVCAASLRVQPFRLFTCIQVQDSVTDGISYFYAEVRRLKRLLDALIGEHRYPLLFLIDEIFRGTNNRERLIGSRAFVRELTAKHGAGIISTHDLELVKLAHEIPDLLNYHFREEVAEGRMVFDYRLHSGPSPTTNALKIMEMEGLPI